MPFDVGTWARPEWRRCDCRRRRSAPPTPRSPPPVPPPESAQQPNVRDTPPFSRCQTHNYLFIIIFYARDTPFSSLECRGGKRHIVVWPRVGPTTLCATATAWPNLHNSSPRRVHIMRIRGLHSSHSAISRTPRYLHCAVSGLWCLVSGFWSLVFGFWFLEFCFLFPVACFWFLASELRLSAYDFGFRVQVVVLWFVITVYGLWFRDQGSGFEVQSRI